MDLQTTIIGLMSLALGLVPVLYLQGKSKKERKALFTSFTALTKGHDLTITMFDTWGPNYVIGLDQEKCKLFYCKMDDSEAKGEVIDLLNVRQCAVQSDSRDINGNKVFDRIELIITHLSSTKPSTTSLMFYLKEESLNLSDELVLAEKWKGIVNSIVLNKGN